MRLLSLFSGIGGFDLAAEWAGIVVAGQVEIDKFCQRVLKKHWPNVKLIPDIKEVRGDEWGTIDIVAGGPPCQPASIAGKRNGTKDNRWLWPEALRVVGELKPRWCLFENPTGILSLQRGLPFEHVLLALEDQDYEVSTVIIPACSVGAPHRRNRVWFIAHAINNSDRARGGQVREENGVQGVNRPPLGAGLPPGTTIYASNSHGFNGDDAGLGTGKIPQFQAAGLPGCHSANSHQPGLEIGEMLRRNLSEEFPAIIGNPWNEHWYEALSRICGIHDGLSRGMDRSKRLRSLGNAIVPQVAHHIFKAIIFCEERRAQ